MRRAFSVSLLVLSAFLIYTAQLLSFMVVEEKGIKAVVVAAAIGVSTGIALFAVYFGRFVRRRRALGITFLSASGLMIIACIPYATLLLEPKLVELVEAQRPGAMDRFALLSDYRFGFPCMAFTFMVGLLLLVRRRQ